MDEIREMTMAEFMVYADLSIPDADTDAATDSDAAPKNRMATQKDIDNLFSL